MDWVKDFYSKTGTWWGKAESAITDRDRDRVRRLHERGGDEPKRILELGSGYGSTAAALAQAGHEVTAVEISDRADFFGELADEAAPGSVTLVKADFYEVDGLGRFDVVCYWSGFGVGSDADQRRLLTRIGAEWLRPGGLALVDVYNPFVWARWDGDEEHRMPSAAAGYDYELHERTQSDPVTSTAVDTWWEVSSPERTISQRLRCYSPADLTLLVAGTGLTLTGIVVGERLMPVAFQPSLRELLTEHHEYLAVFEHETNGR